MKFTPPKAVLFFFGWLLILMTCFAPTVTAARKQPQPIISRITIRGTNIFDLESNVSLHHFPYTTINFLHVQTKEHILRQELLFKVGDRYDPFLIHETERNLRALSFIRAARVAIFPQRDGTVALVVHVNDAWTTEPQINLSGINKVETKEFGFKEKNLFGLGKTIGIFYKKGDQFVQREYSYTDPRLLGSRWQLKANALSRTDRHDRNVSLERPFYAADTKWSARASYDRDISTIDEFDNNILVSRYEQTRETGEMFAGTKIGGGRDLVNHAGLRYQDQNKNFARTDETAPTRSIPSHDDLQTIFLDMDSTRSKFIEMTRLEKMTRVEDVNLGPLFRVSPGISPRFLNTLRDTNTTQFETSFEKRHLTKADHLLYERFAYAGRNTFGNGENQRYDIRLKYYYRPNEHHTLVLNTRAEWGDNLDPDNQVKLGGDNGLRAFKVDSIVGTKGWVFNVEDRLFLVDEVFNLVSFGLVAFYDTGYVWAQGDPIALSKLRSDAGLGFRFGLTRSSNEVIVRLDFAYRLQRLQSEDSHFVVTFGTDQAF